MSHHHDEVISMNYGEQQQYLRGFSKCLKNSCGALMNRERRHGEGMKEKQPEIFKN